MRVLIIENNEPRAKKLDMSLAVSGFNVYICGAVDEAFELVELYDYDIIVLSLNVYGAKDFIVRLRTARIGTPILCLCDKKDSPFFAELLSSGVDDVIESGFHRAELSARLSAIIRRSRGHPAATITTGPLTIDMDSKVVSVNGNPVHLTGKEYNMLELMSLRKGNMLTKEAFLNHLYGGMDEPEAKIIDVFVCKIRKKLAHAGADNVIHTVWGRGYRLDDPTPPVLLPDLTNA